MELPDPTPGFEPIADAVAVMAGQVDRCTVNGETVIPSPAALRRVDHQLGGRTVQAARLGWLVNRLRPGPASAAESGDPPWAGAPGNMAETFRAVFLKHRADILIVDRRGSPLRGGESKSRHRGH